MPKDYHDPPAPEHKFYVQNSPIRFQHFHLTIFKTVMPLRYDNCPLSVYICPKKGNLLNYFAMLHQ